MMGAWLTLFFSLLNTIKHLCRDRIRGRQLTYVGSWSVLSSFP